MNQKWWLVLSKKNPCILVVYFTSNYHHQPPTHASLPNYSKSSNLGCDDLMLQISTTIYMFTLQWQIDQPQIYFALIVGDKPQGSIF